MEPARPQPEELPYVQSRIRFCNSTDFDSKRTLYLERDNGKISCYSSSCSNFDTYSRIQSEWCGNVRDLVQKHLYTKRGQTAHASGVLSGSQHQAADKSQRRDFAKLIDFLVVKFASKRPLL